MQRNPTLRLLPILAAAVVLAACGGGEEPTPSATPTAEPTPAATPAASATPELNADLLDRRWTVLYVGTDVNDRRAEDPAFTPNADALLLVSLSADQSELTLVSLPRDTVDIPLPDDQVWARKVNALYHEEGVETLVDAMEELFGIPIDGYVVLDMEDFTSLVGAVDGVDVSPPEPLVDPKVSLDIEAGPQEIDAATANAYVRTRVDQDYGRMGRQQEVILALVERLTDEDRSLDLRELLDGFDSLETDLPLDELATLIELARRATDAEVTNLVVSPPLITFEGDRGDGRGYILEADVDAIRDEVQRLIGE